MRHYKKVTKTYTADEYIKTTCDKCNEIIPRQKHNRTRDFTLETTTGTSYPDSGHQRGWSVDLCDECVEWLKSVLLNNEVELVPVEIDW